MNRNLPAVRLWIAGALLAIGAGVVMNLAPSRATGEEPFDIQRAKRVMEKSKSGQELTDDEKAYLARVRQEIAKKQGKSPGGTGKTPGTPGKGRDGKDLPTVVGPEVAALVPITDLTSPYKGEGGGLYGGGRNDPPEAHYAAYLKESAKIQPLDAQGKPDAKGKIGFISIGFSNSSMEFSHFKGVADADAQKSESVVLLNGAIGGRSAVMWAYDGAEALSKEEQERLEKEMDTAHMPKSGRKRAAGLPDKDTWPTLDQRLKEAGLAPQQVQAVWLKQVEAGPQPLGDFPGHAKALEQDMAAILLIAKKKFVNLRVALVSSRTFAGWSGPASGSPEPYAYESGFAVRWLIGRQIQGDTQLNYDAARGPVAAPILIWGPYLWTSGTKPRQGDGLLWQLEDVREDHLHPSDKGCQKVTGMLLGFLKNDAGCKGWFLK